MSEILCRWINTELKLSKCVDPKTLSADFANGYLIGEMLHKYQLQDDFDQFSKGRTANSKLNNYSRIEPTLRLLGVPFDAAFAQALMQEVPGAATRLLYQLFVLLEKKRRVGLTGAIMETMQPAATARLHRMEREVYSERLRTVVKREADKQLQKISQRYEFRGHEMFRRSIRVQREKQQEMQRVDREMHLKEIEERRLARKKQHEFMVQLQNTADKTPAALTKQSLRPPERQWRQERKQKEAQDVQREIARFERNLKKQLPVENLSSSVPYGLASEGLWPEEVALTSSEYVLKIRQRLERDAAAREQREKRRKQALMRQLQAHEEQQEAIRDEQLVARLTRHTKQEKRIVVQLMQIHQQKEVLRQNRIFREKQYQEQRLRDFQEALDREAALAQQARLEHTDELHREKEMHDRIATERAQARHKKHFDACQDILGQIVDLATRVGEFRLLTGNRIPGKLMREWKELFFHGMPLYEGGAVENPASELTQDQARETEQLEILNNQDYDEYTSMMGEWVWPGEGGGKEPPPNNCILAHVVTRLQAIVESPKSAAPPSFVLGFTLKACVLGKPFAGKTTCLARINQTHGIHILSVSILIQEALEAFRTGEVVLGTVLDEAEPPESRISSSEDCEEVENDHGKGQDVSGSIESGLLSHHFQQQTTKKKEPKSKLSVRAQQGAAAEKILRKGKAIPDELLVEIIVEAIRRVPSESGWILDGFPVHLNQAKLLEKALCGFNPDDGIKKQRNREPNLAVDPNALKEVPPPPPVPDVVLLLDVPDDLVLDRAAKQALEQGGSGPAEEESGAEAAPEAEEEASTKPQHSEKASPLKPKGLAMSPVQRRVTAFHGNWPNLEKWYSRRQDILVRVNAEEEPDVVFRKVESILYKTMLQQADGGTTRSQTEEVTATSAPEHPHDRGTGTTELPANPPADVAYVDEPLPKEIPEYLAPHWQNVCTSYVTNIKTVMQNVRAQRSLIIQHLYNIREEFKQYLKRPDLKQEFVVQWQQEYNNIPQDMRSDGETRAEIHLRLDELRERLWDICDQRREEARQEQAAIEGDGWIDDHTAMLINHYAALMQVELDRFQDTILLLRDYYSGMLGQIHPETVVQFSHVPMLDITEDKGDVQAEKDGKEKRTQIIPLISWRPSSTEADMKQMDGHPSEKLLDSIWQAALTAVNSLVAIELQHRKVAENEETQQRMEQENQQRESQASVTSHNIKEKKKGSRKKDAQSPVQERSPFPPMEEDEEEMRRRAVRAQIREEHAIAVDVEDCRVRARLELIQARALSVVRDLQLQVQQTYQTMQDKLSARFLAEMTSIDKLVELVGQHIESGSQIKYQLVLEGPDFFMDGEKRVVDPPAPPPRPPPWELPQDSTLTILQLRELHTQFYKVAPTGQLCAVEFSEILRWLVSLHMGSDTLPKLWKRLSIAQIMNLVSALSQDSELLDWRRFLLSAAMPWPVPTQAQLLEVLAQFRAADSQGTGFVTEESYLQTELWFPSERTLPPPDDPSEPLPYDRLANLKKFFFTLFADHTLSSPHLVYETMLLYFAMHPDCEQGWVRALSVVTGQPLRCRPCRAPLLKSVPYIEEASDYAQPEGEAEPAGSEERGTVTIPDLLKVACHGGPRSSTHNRFRTSWKKREEYEEDFRKVYEELGFGAEDEVPFSLLSQHPTLQELMESSVQYQLTDMHCVLQAQLGENESHSQFPLS